MTAPGTRSAPRRLRLPALTGPHRVYQGWYVAWVAFLSTGFPIGMAQYAFGVFIGPLEEEFGWSRGQITLALSLGFIQGIIAPFVGRLVDRIGARPVMVVSLALMAAGFLLRPLISELWHLYLFSALVYLGFPGSTGVVTGRLVGRWFPTTRGRMLGTVTAGNNFGGLTMSPLAALVVGLSGWRWAYVTFGILMALLAVAALLIVRERNEDVAAEAKRTGRAEGFAAASRAAARSGFALSEVVKMPAFWLICAGLMCASLTYQGILTQVVPHLENEGLQRGHAVAALSLIAAMGIASKLVFGRMTESIGARKATVICVAVQAAGVGLMVLPFGTPSLWAGVFVFGLGFGGLGALIVLSVTETFGLKAFGSIMGVVSLVLIVPIAVGPVMAGTLYDATASYRGSFTIVLGVFAVGIMCMLLARPPKMPETK